jgi:acetyltransferase-like isoleucine patch superfamily enzyme
MWWKSLERRVATARRQIVWHAVHWGWREFQNAGMVTADTPAGRAFARFGRGSLMAFPAGSVFGEGSIEIGDDTLIGAVVSLSAGLVPGPYVYITDQNHGYEDPDVPIGRQFPVNRPVSIGSGSWLGAGAIVLPGARIGRNVVIAAGSVVRGEIPDRCVVAGVPARVIREHTDAGWLSPNAPA